MTLRDYFMRFGLALGVGLLIGIQRESVHDEPVNKLFAGARTFALLSLAGYVMAAVGDEMGSAIPFFGGLLVFGTLMAFAYRADLTVGKPGMTTEMSALITYGTGALCYSGPLPLGAALGVTVTAMLSLKHELRSFTHAVTRADIYAMVKFAVVSIIVLPVLPNQAYGPPPLNVLNPYSIWLMVVFVSGISFLGYVLIKVVGPRRGITLTGLLGGLASSTAVTLGFAERSKQDTELARPFALAVLVAWMVMYVRVGVVVLALSPALAGGLMLSLLIPMVAGLVYAGYLFLAQRSLERESVEFSNPFELGPALRFGLIYAVVLLGSRAAQVYLGNPGIYASGFLAGLVGVDATVLSMVDLTVRGSSLSVEVARRAIIIAATANTLFKGAFALSAGSSGFRRALWPGLLLMLAAGVWGALII